MSYFIGVLVISISILMIYQMTKKNVSSSNQFGVYDHTNSGKIPEHIDQIPILETKHEIPYEETPQSTNNFEST